jgi:hypothetical protein
MTRTLLLLLLVACSGERDFAPTAPSCKGIGCAPPTGVGGPGGGISDSSVADTAGGDAIAVGDAGVAVTAVVRALTRFTDEPSAGTVVTMSTILRANKFGGGTTDSTVLADGTHTIRDVVVTPGVPTTFSVVRSGIVKALDGVWLPATGTINVPLFDENLAQTMWPALVPGVIFPPNTAHAVVHVTTGGARRAGVTSLATGDAKGPFYDDGSDIAPGKTATGTKGTIVFLGSTSASIDVTLNAGAKTASYRLPLTANAVTHVAIALE